MIRLENQSGKEFVFTMTKNPVTNPRQSPMPTGKRIEDLDPTKADYKVEKDKILNSPYYSPNFTVVLKPGLNEFENEEWAEYLYSTLGNPEEAGIIPVGAGQTVRVKNSNFLIEVDDKGKEVKDNLFKKYRMPTGVQINKEPDPELFKLKKVGE